MTTIVEAWYNSGLYGEKVRVKEFRKEVTKTHRLISLTGPGSYHGQLYWSLCSVNTVCSMSSVQQQKLPPPCVGLELVGVRYCRRNMGCDT